MYATSVSAQGLAARVLGALRTNEHGAWVSHLVETRPVPSMLDVLERAHAEVMRLRFTDAAHEVLDQLGGNASWWVDRYVGEAWEDARRTAALLLARMFTVEQLGALWRIAHALRPSTPWAMEAAVGFANVEPRWRDVLRGTALNITTEHARLVLDLFNVVPVEGAVQLLLGEVAAGDVGLPSEPLSETLEDSWRRLRRALAARLPELVAKWNGLPEDVARRGLEADGAAMLGRVGLSGLLSLEVAGEPGAGRLYLRPLCGAGRTLSERALAEGLIGA